MLGDDVVVIAARSAGCAGAGLDGRKVSAETLSEFRGGSVGFWMDGAASGVACEV